MGNFFPNNGDMVIDTGDNFYNSTGSNSLRLRNVLAHEAGHGVGNQPCLPGESDEVDGTVHQRGLRRPQAGRHSGGDTAFRVVWVFLQYPPLKGTDEDYTLQLHKSYW